MIIATILFIFATIIGGWRQMNTVLQVRHPHDVARYWMNPAVRSVTWIIVATLALVSCYILSKEIQTSVGELFGQFMFGVLLLVRWLVSMGLSTFTLSKWYTIDEIFHE